MNDTVRAFVAIEMPTEATEFLAGTIDRLRSSGVSGLRVVRAEGVHLTLRFLGSVEAGRIRPIVDSVSEIARSTRPFAVSLEGVGGFPRESAPSVLWMGIAGDVPRLLEMQGRIEQALVDLGFEPERRGFSPHLTVARLDRRGSASDRRAAMRALADAYKSPGPEMTVDSVSLIRSILHRGGAEYKRLARMLLRTDGGQT